MNLEGIPRPLDVSLPASLSFLVLSKERNFEVAPTAPLDGWYVEALSKTLECLVGLNLSRPLKLAMLDPELLLEDPS